VLIETADYMARAIGSAVNLLNPQRVVLGGYLAEAGETILAPLRDALPRYALREYRQGLDIRPAELGDDAAFCGMVAQVRERSFRYPLEGMHVHPAEATHTSPQERRTS
jgi:predicted NBD/HSP70 family sugar kinase